MVEVSQGQIYECDFGVQRGKELACRRLALVVSHDEHNRSGTHVLALPTTRGDGGVDRSYLEFYPWLEGVGTRASCRNIRSVSGDLLGALQGTATPAEFRRVLLTGIGPYFEDALFVDESEFSPGTIHRGMIPNHRGKEEEACFLILPCNEGNLVATVVKVDEVPVGESQVRIALELEDSPLELTAFCHQVQSIDIIESFEKNVEDNYVARVNERCVEVVVNRLLVIMRLADRYEYVNR